jgi:hypothetical protein
MQIWCPVCGKKLNGAFSVLTPRRGWVHARCLTHSHPFGDTPKPKAIIRVYIPLWDRHQADFVGPYWVFLEIDEKTFMARDRRLRVALNEAWAQAETRGGVDQRCDHFPAQYIVHRPTLPRGLYDLHEQCGAFNHKAGWMHPYGNPQGRVGGYYTNSY